MNLNANSNSPSPVEEKRTAPAAKLLNSIPVVAHANNDSEHSESEDEELSYLATMAKYQIDYSSSEEVPGDYLSMEAHAGWNSDLNTRAEHSANNNEMFEFPQNILQLESNEMPPLIGESDADYSSSEEVTGWNLDLDIRAEHSANNNEMFEFPQIILKMPQLIGRKISGIGAAHQVAKEVFRHFQILKDRYLESKGERIIAKL